MSLSSSAVLVELSISSWSGRKLDRKVTQEVNQNKGANKDASRTNKNLFAGSDRLEKINNFVSAARQEYYAMTLPWSTSGARLLPFKEFFGFKEWTTKKETEFGDIVHDFLQEYSTLISAQAFRLGSMFSAAEYPPASELQNKFRFLHTVLPVPEAGDFRVDAEGELKKELEAQYAAAYEERTSVAMNDLWSRLYETVSHLSEKCGQDKPRVYDSMLEGALELCGLLTRLNVTNDSALEARRQELEKALCGVQTEDLRKDEHVRAETKTKMDELLAKMGGLGLC